MTTLTATQLRNARKRRARKKNEVPQPPPPTAGVTSSDNNAIPGQTIVEGATAMVEENPVVNTGNKRKRTDQFCNNNTSTADCSWKKNNGSGVGVDPSQRYSSNPLRAPIVQRAQQFFHELFRHTPTNSFSNAMDAITVSGATNNDNSKNYSNTTCDGNGAATSITGGNAGTTKFPIYVGSIYGWRTVVKLPVRYCSTATTRINGATFRKTPKHTITNTNTAIDPPLITIGLFAPGSHHIVPIVAVGAGPKATDTCLCQTHHPAINQAIIHIQHVARSLQQQQQQQLNIEVSSSKATTTTTTKSTTTDHTFLTAFSEETGQGYLRHIALSLQRHTNLIQLVVVWNSTPPLSSSPSSSFNHSDADSAHIALMQFLKALLLVKTKTKVTHDEAYVQWHSIWVHYNNSWKHANAIFTHDGVWELLYHHKQVATESEQQRDDDCPIGGITEYLPVRPTANREATETTLHHLPQIPLHFPPHVFRQGNITAFTKIVQSIRNVIIHQFYPIVPNSKDITKVKNRPSCLELYGGVGTIGLHIVDLCSKFVCSDENPYNVQCFNASVTAISVKGMHESIRYESASASVMVLERKEHINDIDIIIVDPPRKGMGADVCHALTSVQPPKTTARKTTANGTTYCDDPQTTTEVQQQQQQQQQMLIYVSCGFDAFVRDYQVLTQTSAIPSSSLPYHQSKAKRKTTTSTVTGRMPWTLVHAEGHVLFPGSDAIETLAIFTREKYPTVNR